MCTAANTRSIDRVRAEISLTRPELLPTAERWVTARCTLQAIETEIERLQRITTKYVLASYNTDNEKADGVAVAPSQSLTLYSG